MALLYTKSPSGDLFSHEIKCGSYSVGGNAATSWNQHYCVLHNGYLIFGYLYIRPDRIFSIPFKLWSPVYLISRIAFQNEDIPTGARTDYAWIDDTNLTVTIKSDETNTVDRVYSVFIFGEINLNPD